MRLLLGEGGYHRQPVRRTHYPPLIIIDRTMVELLHPEAHALRSFLAVSRIPHLRERLAALCLGQLCGQGSNTALALNVQPSQGPPTANVRRVCLHTLMRLKRFGLGYWDSLFAQRGTSDESQVSDRRICRGSGNDSECRLNRPDLVSPKLEAPGSFAGLTHWGNEVKYRRLASRLMCAGQCLPT
jgi:hypothetical protein